MSVGKRIAHLDLLRGSMMALGVLVHASHADYDLGNYAWVRFLSDSFRMATFFLISGYLIIPQRERYGPTLLRRRVVTLGVPALVCVVLLNPLVLRWTTAYYATAPEAAVPRMNWHGHAWFLLVLMAYTLLARPGLVLIHALRRRLVRLGPVGTEAALFAGAVALCTLGVKAIVKFGPMLPGYGGWGHIAEAGLENLPFFFLGAAMYASPALYRFAHARPLAWITLAVAAVAVRYSLVSEPITTVGRHLLEIGWRFATRVTCAFALVGVFALVVKERNRWVELVSKSAYTVYLIHYLIVAFVLLQAERLGLSMLLRVVAATVLGFAGGVAVHVWLVQRVKVAAFLLNGRMPERSPPVSAVSRQSGA